MLPRSKLSRVALNSQRRLASTKARQPSAAQLEKRTAKLTAKKQHESRTRKAERDERMSITAALTPVKEYMSGFNRPTEIRAANWFPGGRYSSEKHYASPAASAYEPHTVYLLESRYPVRHGIDRPASVEHIVGVCRADTFPQTLRRYNSPQLTGGPRQAMDNAVWPWNDVKTKPTKWWSAGEREQIAAEWLQKDEEYVNAGLSVQEASAEQASSPRVPSSGSRMLRRSSELVSTDLLHSGVSASGSATQQRMFHTSHRASVESGPPSGPGSFKARTEIPASSWARPHKPSQDADDDVVPSYYVERKMQRSSVAERKEEEGGLMAELSAGILSEGVAAKTRPREEKIPVEVRDPRDGTVRHPSGFAPPTPETHFHPAAAKTATEDHPMLATIKQSWDERPPRANARAPVAPDENVEAEFIERKMQRGQAQRVADADAARVLVDHARTEQGPSGTFDELSVPAGSTTAEQRADISTSSWDTPRRSPRWEQHPEDVVPTYYVERKRQRDSVAERKEEEGGLMAELNAGILGEGLAAEMRHREEKMPVEVRDPHDGTVRHPSGFKPPTPETHFHPTSAKAATEDHPIVTTMKVPWTEAPTRSQVQGQGQGQTPQNGNGNGSRQFHTSAPARATAVSHNAFDLMSLARAPKPVVQPADPVTVEEAGATVASNVERVRGRYLPTLAAQPFWRPLLALTFQTRPLADSVERLAKGLPRGTPFHASISAEDRKDGASFGMRMRNLRLARMEGLTVELARLLRGEWGGLVGVRFGAEELGRCVRGEGLADPVSLENRMISVSVGSWYRRADEVQEAFRQAAAEAEVEDTMEVFAIDEHGNKVSETVQGTPQNHVASTPAQT